MGNKGSRLQVEGLDQSEIARLSKRFQKLDVDRLVSFLFPFKLTIFILGLSFL